MKKRLVRGVLLEIISFLALLIPIFILTLINKDKWFIHGADKISLGFIIALIFAVLLLKGAFKNVDNRLTTIGVLFVLLILVWCFQTIMDDLFWVILCSIFGYGAYLLVNIFARKDLNYVKEYKSEKARMDARLDAKKAVEENKTQETTERTGW